MSYSPRVAKDAFLEELITRRELSDNFCFYNTDYDSTRSFPEWARKTLSYHIGDAREYVYGPRELESAETHDPLWNAAQRDGYTRSDARISPHVLGEEDLGVERKSRVGFVLCDLSQRQV